MGHKDLGPNVSQTPADIASGNAYSGEEKAFEAVVILEDKPVIDWEMNLRSEIKRDYGLRLSNQRQQPSCFLVSDVLERSDILGSYAPLAPVPGTTENKFQLRATNAVLNGWDVRVEYSETSTPGFNDIQLGAPPAAGARTDLVILEIWRALVDQPNATNKSPTSLILRYGNVKAPDAVNFADDLLDPNYALESSARVQIQYRYRVIEGVNLDTYPDGLDDPVVFAHTVSDFSGPGADGTVTALNYSPVPDDAGLWRAGSGDAAGTTALGTVDGYMYAVPICGVARRNTTAFNRITNLNGGNLMAAVTPTRPDGIFADQIIIEDIKDLRKVCARDTTEVLQKAYQQVLDNSMTTELEASPFGTSGTSIFAVDNMINPPEHIGEPEAVRRHFSDRSITETAVCWADIGGLPTSGATFTVFQFKTPWYSFGYNLSINPGVTILGVKSMRIVDAIGLTDYDMLDAASPIHAERMLLNAASDSLTVLFNATTTSKRIFAELMVEYPAGLGVQRNMLHPYAFWTRRPGGPSHNWIDTSTFLPTSDVNRDEVPFPVPAYSRNLWWVDPGHRELSVRYETVLQSVVYYTTAVDELKIPERLNGDTISINDGINPVYTTTSYTLNTAYTTVQLNPYGVPAGTPVTVDYVAFRPLPGLGFAPANSHQLFYQSAAIQSLLPPSGTQTLPLIPRDILNFLTVLTVGSGSPSDSFPFVQASGQLPVGALPAVDFPESKLDNPSDVSLIGFGINTGHLQIPALIPYVPAPQEVTLHRDATDPVIDAEGRNFWPRSDDGTTPLYSPVAFGQELAFPQRHKVALPLLAELKTDFPSIGRKGTLVLVVLTRWINFDSENGVSLTPTQGESAAAVYRVRGNMMNPQRTDV
jgi:hypothetical protein